MAGAVQSQENPLTLFEWIEKSPYTERVDQRDEQVRAHLIGLGRIKKVRGDWSPEKSERVSGRLVTSTWRIVDGESSADMFEEAVAGIKARDDARVLFACSARDCGASVQWANMVFGQRILYGTESSQHYAVYALGSDDDSTHRIVVYAAARTSARQYLYTEIVELEL
ncbi:MAG: DUF4892 domain-containing protein [Chromatocurvus sp.]